MGRGYKSSGVKFLDFTSKPNFDMHLKLANQEVKEHYAKSKLLNTAPDIEVDYWGDAHKDIVQQKQEQYQNQIEEITQSIYNSDDLSNINKFLPDLKRVKRDLTKDFTSGDLYNIQESAKNHRDYIKKLETLKNPEAKEAYKKYYEDAYLDGDRKGVFEVGEMYDTRNLDEEFMKSQFFKALPISKNDYITKSNSSETGYVTTKSGTVTKVTPEQIENAYRQFINSQTGLKEYAEHRQKVFKESNWLNAEKELDLSEEGFLGSSMKNLADTYSYKNITNRKESVALDPLSKIGQQITQARNSGNSSKKGLNIYDKLDKDFIGKQTMEGIELTRQFNNSKDFIAMNIVNNNPESSAIFESLKTDEERDKFLQKSYNQALNSVDKDGNPTSIAQKLKRKESLFEEKLSSGYKAYSDKLSPADFKQFQSYLDSNDPVKAMANEDGYIKFSNGSTFGDSSRGEKHKIESIVGSDYISANPKFNGLKIKRLIPVDKSFIPLSLESLTDQSITGGAVFYQVELYASDENKESGSPGISNNSKKETIIPLETITFIAPDTKLNFSVNK